MKIQYIIYFIATALLLNACADTADESFAAPPGSGSEGVGGSLARFAISGDQLYTVDNSDLKVFDISNPSQPTKVNELGIGWGIETIFPRGNALFIGSQTGMFIYDIRQPRSPEFLSNVQHVFSCDPVVADDRYAYVTLRSIQNVCGRFTNQLDIIDIEDLTRPELIITYPMVSPQGLGVDDGLLFVCDDGLKVYDNSNVRDLKLLQHFDIVAHDVIPINNLLLVVGDDGFYQYRYFGENIELLSRIPVDRLGS